MKKIYDAIDSVIEDEHVEVASLSVVKEILAAQEDTKNETLTAVKDITLEFIREFFADSRSQRTLERERLKFEREKFEYTKRQSNYPANPCIRKSTENLSELPPKTLATKSSASPKSKAKDGSRARKKTT